MSNIKQNFGSAITFQFAVTTSGTPEKLTVKKVAATIAFVNNAALTTGENRDTITDSGLGFLAAGFAAGDILTVAGSSSNDGTYVIDEVAAGTITLKANESLTNENVGATVKLTAPKMVPDGVAVTIKAKKANNGIIHVGNSSATALNTGGGSFTLAKDESLGLQVTRTDAIWLDTTASTEGVEVIFEKGAQA